MSDSTRAILERTHAELVDREARLAAFGRELTVTTQARKDLEKTLAKLGDGQAPAPATKQLPARTGGNQTPGSSPRERFTERVIEVLRDYSEGIDAQHIAAALGRGCDPYLQGILANAALKGLLIEDEGLYTAPVQR